jgi:hypothetical protein
VERAAFLDIACDDDATLRSQVERPLLAHSQASEIRMLLGKEVSKASIAKIVGVSRTAVHHFILTRKLDPKDANGRTRGRRR